MSDGASVMSDAKTVMSDRTSIMSDGMSIASDAKIVISDGLSILSGITARNYTALPLCRREKKATPDTRREEDQPGAEKRLGRL